MILNIILVNGVSKTYPRYEMQKLMENRTVDNNNINFIPSVPINNDLLSYLFSKIQIARKKDLLNKSLAENFDENIVEFDFILGEPKFFVLNREEAWVPLSEFGEGIKRFISIISKMINKLGIGKKHFLDCSKFTSKDNHKSIINQIYKIGYPNEPYNYEHPNFNELKDKLKKIYE
jgi:hypothetical protein